MSMRRIIAWCMVVVILLTQSGMAHALNVETFGKLEHAKSAAAKNSTENIGGVTELKTHGEKAYGTFINQNNASINYLDKVIVTTSGQEGFAAVIQRGGSSINYNGEATITTSGQHGYGAWINAINSSVNYNSKATVTTRGYSACASWAYRDNSSITYNGDATITTSGENSEGSVAGGNNSRITFNKKATITTGAKSAHGTMIVGANSWVDYKGKADITTNGTNARGAFVDSDNSSVNYKNIANIKTEGKDAHGAEVSGTSSSVNYSNEAKITTGNSGAVGALVSGNDSKINYKNKAVVTTKGDGAHGAKVGGIGSSVIYSDKADVTTSGKAAHGTEVTGPGSSISYGDRAVIMTSGEEAHGAYTKNASAAIEFEGDTSITAGGDRAYALFAEQGKITSARGKRHTINGDMAAGTGTIDMDMAAGSLFTGKTNSGSGNISLAMTDSLWSVSGSSSLTSLNLGSSTVDYSGTDLGTVVTVNTLNGSGNTLIMKTDIANELGDKLEVTGTTNGSRNNITVRNRVSAAAAGNEVITLVDTADTTSVFTLNNEQDLELGAWQYRLRQVSGGLGSKWQLYAAGLSPTAGAIVDSIFASYLLSYAETQTLIQRLGGLRETPRLSGLWFKVHGGSFQSEPNHLTSAFGMDYSGVQLGYDRKLDTGWNGDFYAGVMFGYSKGNNSFENDGSGKIESKTLGAYGTFIDPNGFFADLVLRYQWMDSDFDVVNTTGAQVKGDSSNNGFGVSLELGQRIPFAGEQKTGWYAEPQVQLSYMRQSGGPLNPSNGLQIETEPYTSVLGRLGILVGYEKEDTNFYAKVSRVKEFDGDMTIMANSQPVDTTFAGSWWVYGMGFTSRLNEKNSIYLDIERASGGLFTQKWAAKAGWRVEF